MENLMRGHRLDQIGDTKLLPFQIERIIAAMLEGGGLLFQVEFAANVSVQCFRSVGKAILAYTGGRAANVRDIAVELVTRLAFDCLGLAAVALTKVTLICTIGKDDGSGKIFAKTMCAIGQAAEVSIGYSKAGQSLKILEALCAAREVGCPCTASTGNRRNPMRELCHHPLEVLSAKSPASRKVQMVLGHIRFYFVEHEMFGLRN